MAQNQITPSGIHHRPESGEDREFTNTKKQNLNGKRHKNPLCLYLSLSLYLWPGVEENKDGEVKRRVERSARLGQVDILPIFEIFPGFVCFKIFTFLNFKSSCEVTQNWNLPQSLH